MTISSESIKAGPFSGNDSTTTFAFTFKCFAQGDLKVVLTNSSGVDTTLTITTDYTVSLNANQDTSPGGSITTTGSSSPPATGEKLTILNEPAYTQGTDLITGGGFYPDVVETALDRSTILARRAKEEVGRSIQIPVSDSAGTTVLLPTNTLRADKALVFDATGSVGVSVDDYVDQTTASAASATAAASSAAAASTSASASATSATAAAASYDSFDDRYLGTKSSDPSVDNDGATLLDGALYFNTSNNVMMVYDLGTTTWLRTTPTSGDQTHINTVSGIQANVTTVAGISGNVTTVAGISSNVSTVAGISSAVSSVAADATDIGAVAAKATEIGRLGTADAVTDMSILGTAAIVTDMSILGTAAVVEDMSILGTADVVTDMSILATSDIVTDMSILATSDIVTDMSILGTAAVVEDMSILGTAAVVEDLSILGTAAIVEDLSILGTAAVVTDMDLLGATGVIDDLETCADNVAGISNFAARYRVDSSDPVSSLDEGDLAYNSTANVLKYYNGSAWITIVAGSLTDVVQDGSPQLGADLDVQTFDIVSTTNRPITITPNGSGDVILDGLKYPQADGDAGQFLKTNGSAQLSFETIQGGDLSTEGSTFANYNTISDDVTTTTLTTKNMFLKGTMSVADTKTWTIAGNGVLHII